MADQGLGKPMPPGALKSPRSYGTNNANEPCYEDRVSYPNAFKNNESAGQVAPKTEKKSGY